MDAAVTLDSVFVTERVLDSGLERTWTQEIHRPRCLPDQSEFAFGGGCRRSALPMHNVCAVTAVRRRSTDVLCPPRGGHLPVLSAPSRTLFTPSTVSSSQEPPRPMPPSSLRLGHLTPFG